VALVIVHFVESLGGIQAVHAFRREPRNQDIFDHLDARYQRANVGSQRLAAAYGPGIQLVGRLVTAGVLLYGGMRVINGSITIGLLTTFLLYLRRFFEPMQELSQFYNLCLVNIPLLSVPAFVLAFSALRGLAPTRPTLAGAAAGLSAGAAAAFAYAIHCPELTAPFLGAWYVIGMLVPTAMGALLGRHWLRW
jgi:ABC-type multidrug transport system fused ATPase/permease subunit